MGNRDISELESFINNSSSTNFNNSTVGLKSNGKNSSNSCIVNSNDNNNKKSKEKNRKQDHNNSSESSLSKINLKIDPQISDNLKKTNYDSSVHTNKTINKTRSLNSFSFDETSNHPNQSNAHRTSPELSSSYVSGTKSTKKNKSKRRNDKTNKELKKISNSTSDSKLSEMTNGPEKCETQENETSDSIEKSKQTNSSSDDLEDVSDAEDDDKIDLDSISRSKKSNSSLPSSKKMDLQDIDDEFCTVSDSEMADREKDFILPKGKYLKRKKNLARNFNQQNSKDFDRKTTGPTIKNYTQNRSGLPSFSTTINQASSNFNKVDMYNEVSKATNHHLSRGYESERESSVNNSIANSNSVSQSLSSSMLAIDRQNQNNSIGRVVSKTNSPLDQFFEDQFPPPSHSSVTLHSANSDNHLNCLNENNDSSKMPSYAEIAKSFNVINTKAQVATKLSNFSENSVQSSLKPTQIKEEFPKLADQSSSTMTKNCTSSSLSDNILKTHELKASVAAPQTISVVTTTASDTANKVEMKNTVCKLVNSSIVLADNYDESNDKNSKIGMDETDAQSSMLDQTMNKNSVAVASVSTHHSKTLVKSKIKETDDIPAFKMKMQINYQNSFKTAEKTTNCSKSIANNDIDSKNSVPVTIRSEESNNLAVDDLKSNTFGSDISNQKIVFGFFDDIQEEFDELQVDNNEFKNNDNQDSVEVKSISFLIKAE